MAHRNKLKTWWGLLCFLLLAGLSTPALAQFTVTGTVTDANTGEPLLGVNIYHNESGRGTATDLEGTFSLELPGQTATLRISYTGYSTQEVEVSAANNELTITLESNVAQLDQLVVTGLASSIKRENLANAVATVSAEELTGNTTPQTIAGALQGQIAGVQISSYSGAPGGGFNIQLRGISTLGAGSSQPLIIIDGVYLNNSTIATGRSTVTGAGGLGQDNVANRLADINPDNIASIEILKGPSAAAIYGQRANAGVVIITTKGGAPGETRISISQDIGYSSAVNLLGRTKWTEDRIIAFYDDPKVPGLTDKTKLELERYRTAKENDGIRDLEKVFYGNEGLISNTQISVAGGNEKTRFFVSGNIEQEEGIIKGTGFQRRAFRANLEHSLSRDILISSHTSYIHTDSERGFTNNQNGTGASLGYTLSFVPNYAYGLLQQNPDGTYPDNPYFSGNPFEVRDVAQNSQNVDRILQSLSINTDLYTQGTSLLSLSILGGLDYLTSSSLIYLPPSMEAEATSALPGDVVHTTSEQLNTNLQAVLSFNTEVETFELGSQLGVTRFDRSTELNRVRGQGLLPGQTNVLNASRITPFQFFSDVTDIGFFAQQTVNWDDKLIATIGGRMDRSTLNLLQSEYYFYPKASLAVNLPNFDFWTTDAFDQLKLRIAYGETGGLPTFGNTFLSFGNTNIGGIIGTLASFSGVDPELTPERAQELEFGLDVAFFDGRFAFSGTMYTKTVSDLILGLAPAPSTGINPAAPGTSNSYITNAATLENTGIELSLNVIPIQSDHFSWFATVLWWTNETVITELSIPAQTRTLLGNKGFGFTRIEEGVSPTALFGVSSDGEINKLGNFQPDYQMSFSSKFNIYENFELSFLWDMSRGATLINLSGLLSDGAGNTYDFFVEGTQIVDRASGTKRFAETADYIKLRELALYYTVPTDFLGELFSNEVRNVKIGVSGTNLLIISDYSGYDPEVNFTGRSTLLTSVSITPYPPSRQILFHINFEF